MCLLSVWRGVRLLSTKQGPGCVVSGGGVDPHCVFARFARGDSRPASIVLETDTVLAFHDVAPVGPTHILLIPKTLPVASVHEDVATRHPEVGGVVVMMMNAMMVMR